jgi:hypothetical protein
MRRGLKGLVTSVPLMQSLVLADADLDGEGTHNSRTMVWQKCTKTPQPIADRLACLR